MQKKYGQSNLERFKAAEERRQERRKAGSSFFSKLMAGSRKQTESKKYNMPGNISMARAKSAKATAESKGMRDFTAKRTAAAKSAMTKAEAKAKTGKMEAERFARKNKSNKAAPKKRSLIAKIKSKFGKKRV